MTRNEPVNAPLTTLRDGMLKATVWENEGKTGPYHSVTLSKLYEGDDGKLKETQSFSPSDLLHVAELARDAHRVVRDRRRDLSRERDAEPVVEAERPVRQPEPRQEAPRDDRPSRFRGYPAPER